MPRAADTETLLERASQGDRGAVGELLSRYRRRLRQMVAVRIDPRLKSRVDPSDVVQDALMDAARMLPEYLRNRPLPYYPWLRQIAWQRLYDLHVRHLQAQRRSVMCEAGQDMALSDESVHQLARRLAGSGTSPSGTLLRAELRRRVRQSLERLKETTPGVVSVSLVSSTSIVTFSNSKRMISCRSLAVVAAPFHNRGMS
jgi:RNA polymerase sigma-70 factor (ECF subfamily)